MTQNLKKQHNVPLCSYFNNNKFGPNYNFLFVILAWQKKAEPSPNAYGGDPNAPQPSAVTDPNCVTDTSVDFSRLSFEKESEHMVAPVNLDFSQLSFGNVDMPTDSPKQSTPNKQPTVASKQKCPAISGNKPYVNSFEEIHATHKASETACSVKRTETDTYSPISRPVIAGSHNTSSKRQRNINVGEDNDDSQDEVLFSKKQRTRSLELPRTGGKVQLSFHLNLYQNDQHC